MTFVWFELHKFFRLRFRANFLRDFEVLRLGSLSLFWCFTFGVLFLLELVFTIDIKYSRSTLGTKDKSVDFR